MDWQNILAWLAIGLAALFVARSAWRALATTRSGCGGGCGCAKSTDKKPKLIVPEELTLRRQPEAPG